MVILPLYTTTDEYTTSSYCDYDYDYHNYDYYTTVLVKSRNEDIRKLRDKEIKKQIANNADKARNTILILVKIYIPPFKLFSPYRQQKITQNKRLFCNSGFLPKKIRAAKKSKI